MPLGDVWRGVCRAEAVPFVPDDSTLNDLCNMGYAKGRCARYQSVDAGDAVRFLIAQDRDELIRIEYVVERDHHPHRRGAFEYQKMRGALAVIAADPLLQQQALAYVESYLRRKPAAA
jgi:hypothetical protein